MNAPQELDFLSKISDFAKTTAVNWVVEYNRMKIQATIELRNIRKEYFVLDGLIRVFECAAWMLWCAWVHFTHTRLEPAHPEWICVSKYGYLNSYYTADKYQYIGVVDDEYPDVFQSGYNMLCKHFYDTRHPHETGIAFGCFTYNKTVVRLLGYPNADTSFNELNVSSADFLSMEYHCESLPPVAIHIPIAHYLVGNQLLSKEYVLRYLEHLPIYTEWWFNETYRIIGIDNDIHTFVLDCKQYVELTENGYVVRTLPIEETIGKEEEEAVEQEETKEAALDETRRNTHNATEMKDKIE